MNKLRNGMHNGIGLQAVSFALALVCVLLDKSVPDLMPVLLYLGLFITLTCSFLIGKNLRK